jgi:hypothetical protein
MTSSLRENEEPRATLTGPGPAWACARPNVGEINNSLFTAREANTNKRPFARVLVATGQMPCGGQCFRLKGREIFFAPCADF